MTEKDFTEIGKKISEAVRNLRLVPVLANTRRAKEAHGLLDRLCAVNAKAKATIEEHNIFDIAIRVTTDDVSWEIPVGFEDEFKQLCKNVDRFEVFKNYEGKMCLAFTIKDCFMEG